MPLVLLEAMSAGKPLVGSRIGGTVNLTKDGLNGFTFKPEDIVMLSDILVKLINDKRLRKKLGTNSRCIVESVYMTGIK